MRILVMGLPGSGKTTLAKLLAPMFNAVWLNADEVRKQAKDKDFSVAGRMIQASRMLTLAKKTEAQNRVVVADFICPTDNTRTIFKADYTIWMDTIKEGRFEDTNKMFIKPKEYDFRVGHMEADMWAFLIKQDITEKFGSLGPHSNIGSQWKKI